MDAPAKRGRDAEMAAAQPVTDLSALHNRVLDDLGQAICEGRLAAESTITTESLERHYGVSRSVIRESLRALEAMGMVTSKRRVGNRILPSDEWNVYDRNVIRWRLAGRDRLSQLKSLIELRTAIEPAAAGLAASRATLTQASDLVGLAGRLWAAGRGGDSELFLELDVQFHALVLDMSGNQMFSRLNDLVSEVLIGRTHYGLIPQFPNHEALQLHVDVANGIQSGNAEAASQAMIQIMERSMDETSELWERSSTQEDAGAAS
jgi:DNA-binding FadR family transcriptional regulator